MKFTANETGGNFSETAYGSTSLTTSYSTSLTTSYSTKLSTSSAFFAQYEFNLFYLQRGNKHYELTNHTSTVLSTGLGNVLAVITDKRLLSCMGDTIQSSSANIVSATDYSPFGAPLAGRTYQASEYRFGYSGMEKVSEISGEGNYIDYGARIRDVRIGPWLSVDPLAAKYPYLSSYAFVSNCPLLMIDPDGRDNIVYLVVLPDAWTHISIMQMQMIIDKTNKTFKDLGVDAEVRLFSGTDFKAENMDKTDAVTVIGGTKSSVSNFVMKNVNSSAGKDMLNNWIDTKGGTKLEKAPIGGNFIAIDASKLSFFAKEYNSDINSTLSYTINHATGHLAGLEDRGEDIGGTDPAIMTDGSQVKSYINHGYPHNQTFKKLSDFTKIGENSKYAPAVKGKLGFSKKPKDNYQLNATKNALKLQINNSK